MHSLPNYAEECQLCIKLCTASTYVHNSTIRKLHLLLLIPNDM